MSYEIIYDKQFIKVKDKYIPLVLWGSNNCYEYTNGGERRERNWHNLLSYKGKQLWTLDEMMEYCDNELNKIKERYPDVDEKDIIKNFGYYTSIGVNGHWGGTTFGMFKGLFRTGAKKAITVEQLNEEFKCKVEIHSSAYDDEKAKKECKELGIEYLPSEYPITTQSLIDTIDKFARNYENSDIWWGITYSNGHYMESLVKRIRANLFSKERKETKYVETKSYYTILADNGGYFHKYTKYGYKYSYMTDKYRFLTEADANRFIKSKRGRSNLKVEKIESQYPVRVKV